MTPHSAQPGLKDSPAREALEPSLATEDGPKSDHKDAASTPDSGLKKYGGISLESIVKNEIAQLSTKPIPREPRIVHPQQHDDLCYFKPDEDLPMETVFYDGLLTHGDLVVWIGREKHRKSTLLLQLAICAATGRAFLRFPFKPSSPIRVVYVDYESKTRSLKTRYEAMCNAMALSEEERERLSSNLKIVTVRETMKQGGIFPRFPTKDTERDSDRFWTRFAQDHNANLYIFDPMRCVHGSQENDSEIEQLLTRFRQRFQGATVIIAHHMRKQAGGRDNPVKLKDNMREWSDGGRGSVAIKAHSDVIACQERDDSNGTEIIYFGAFMRDGADVTPLSLVETGPESFFFEVVPTVPETCQRSYSALKNAARTFVNKSDAAKVIEQETKLSRPSAFRHIGSLLLCGVLTENDDGTLVLMASGQATQRHALQGAGPAPKRGK
jgi:hypothetical protein